MRQGLACAALALLLVVAPSAAYAQTQEAPAPATAQLKEYRGVTLGMNQAAVRDKLGKPENSDATSDIFSVEKNESTTVYYDTSKNTIAIVTTYLDGKAAPDPMTVFGVAVAPGDDGSINKIVRYQTDGYWVGYNRIAGDQPVVIVTMKRFNTTSP